MAMLPAAWRGFLPLLLGFALLAAPLIRAPGSSNLTYDEATYYRPAIERIRAHWPHLDLVRDSLSATAPGYPYFLASVALVTGPSPTALRTVNWAVSAAVLAVCWWILGQGGAGLGLALLPLLCSNFFVKSAGFIVTDNAALLGIAATLGISLFAPPARRGWLAALTSMGAVGVRQTSIWLLAPQAWQALQQARTDGRWLRAGCLLLPLVPLAVLVHAWHGLVPPAWQGTLSPLPLLSPMPLLYALTVLGTLGSPFYFALNSSAEWRQDFASPWAWGAALVVLPLALLTDSLPDMATGRWGGYWWQVAGAMPAFGRTAPVFVVLAPLGAWLAGAAGVRLWREAGSARSLVLFVAGAAWIAAVFGGRIVFHRYYEPVILVFLCCWVALLASARVAPHWHRRWPLFALAAAQLGLTLVTAHGQAYGLFHP